MEKVGATAILVILFQCFVVPSAGAVDTPWRNPPADFDLSRLFPLLPPPDVSTECRLESIQTYVLRHRDDGREQFYDERQRSNPQTMKNEAHEIDESRRDYRVLFNVDHFKPYIKTYSGTKNSLGAVVTDFNTNPNIGKFWISYVSEGSRTINVTRLFVSGFETLTFQLEKNGTGDLMDYFSILNDDMPSNSLRHLKCQQQWPDQTDWNQIN